MLFGGAGVRKCREAVSLRGIGFIIIFRGLGGLLIILGLGLLVGLLLWVIGVAFWAFVSSISF